MPAGPPFKAASAAAFHSVSSVRRAGRFRLIGGCSGTTGRGVTSSPTNQHRVRFMIESLMLLGIGVCAGCLLVLAFIPLVHRRATRHHDAAYGRRDAARHQCDPGGQGSPARGIRHVGAPSRGRRRRDADQGRRPLGEIGRQRWKSSGCASSSTRKWRWSLRSATGTRCARASCGGWRNWCSTHSSARSAGPSVELFGMVQARSLAHARRAHMAGSQT